MICPKCKAEIDTDSCYCDQCGQEMRYCQSCRKLGKGNRCTACGGRMVPAIEYFKNPVLPVTSDVNSAPSGDEQETGADIATIKAPASMRLVLSNGQLGITIEGVDGAVIGRRHGIYQALFSRFPYVSGRHAQLYFDPNMNRWSITDLHSSNGSKYNDQPLLPGKPCILENGATIQLANITMTVAII